MILDPGFDLTLRPMKYPIFYEQYKAAIKNTWTVEEVDFSTDLADLRERMTPAEQHLINRLVAFFATGDSIVGNNLVLNLYKHINSPEARMYLSRQLFEEAQHVDFYLTLLDTYIAEPEEREKAFDAVENIPSIRKKAEFCFRWIDSINGLTEIRTVEDRRNFLLNLICFACCIEGLFFFAAFPPPTCGNTCSMSPTAAWKPSASHGCFIPKILSGSWNCRTYRNSRIFSSVVCLPTRWLSKAKW